MWLNSRDNVSDINIYHASYVANYSKITKIYMNYIDNSDSCINNDCLNYFV